MGGRGSSSNNMRASSVRASVPIDYSQRPGIGGAVQGQVRMRVSYPAEEIELQDYARATYRRTSTRESIAEARGALTRTLAGYGSETRIELEDMRAGGSFRNGRTWEKLASGKWSRDGKGSFAESTVVKDIMGGNAAGSDRVVVRGVSFMEDRIQGE